MTDDGNGAFDGMKTGKGNQKIKKTNPVWLLCPGCHKLSVEMNKVILQLVWFETEEHIVAPLHTVCLEITANRKLLLVFKWLCNYYV
jgi:hypothetical protein